MSVGGQHRTLREESTYAAAVEKLGGAQLVDGALEVIVEAISLRPEGFDEIPGWAPLRIAKTDRIERAGGAIPALRLWFRIEDESTVSLLYVEAIEEE
jgi:hypothetical protein